MRSRHPITALAVAALYALLLQGFLGALAPVSPLATAVHCAPAGQGAPDQGRAAHDGACCLLACRTVLALPPSAAAPAERAAQSVAPVLPAQEAAAGPAPVAGARARGPPRA